MMVCFSPTGLNMDTAEELQVANYGLGGHYEPHFDYARVRQWEERVAVFARSGKEGKVVVVQILRKSKWLYKLTFFSPIFPEPENKSISYCNIDLVARVRQWEGRMAVLPCFGKVERVCGPKFRGRKR